MFIFSTKIRFWDGFICVTKRNFNEFCRNTSYCDENKSLSCKNYTCRSSFLKKIHLTNWFLFATGLGSCDLPYYYFDIASQKCTEKLDEFTSCSNDAQCLSPMNCSNKMCQCMSTEFFSKGNLTCMTKKPNNTYCESNLQCRSDLYLTCQVNLCQCNLTTHAWLQNKTL